MKYHVTDGNAVETTDRFKNAVALIQSWYCDGFDHATRDAWRQAVEQTKKPLKRADIQEYARTLCNKAAAIEGIDEVVGINDYGKTTYRVSAADRAGYAVRVTME